MSKFIFRAGWPDVAADDWTWRKRFGRWWVWIGPYVFGDLRGF